MKGISLLCPSRARPDKLAAMLSTARETAGGPLELRVYLDDDDPELLGYRARFEDEPRVHLHVAPRIVMSDMWNVLANLATEPILMLCADDLRFRTPLWDNAVRLAFERFPDGIAMVYGRDGVSDKASHPFLTQAWVNALGHVTSGLFVADYSDEWVYRIAEAIDRSVFVPDLEVEHLHPYVNKGPEDQTYREKMERNPDDAMHHLFQSLAPQRAADIEKLRAVMK